MHGGGGGDVEGGEAARLGATQNREGAKDKQSRIIKVVRTDSNQ